MTYYMHDLMQVRAKLVAYDRMFEVSTGENQYRTGERWLKEVASPKWNYGIMKEASVSLSAWRRHGIATFRKTYFIDATRYFKLFLPELTRVKMGVLFDEWVNKLQRRFILTHNLKYYTSNHRLFPLKRAQYVERINKIQGKYGWWRKEEGESLTPSEEFHKVYDSLPYTVWEDKK